MPRGGRGAILALAVRNHDDLTGEIGALLATSPRDLALIERRLTDGYATVLSLEGERWRLERRLAAMPRDDDEHTELTRRIACSDEMLKTLRDRLAHLRGEYSAAVETAGRTEPRRRAR
jgi:hypothetical protein